jgi:hypothetical protein
MEVQFDTLVANYANVTAIPYSAWIRHPLKWKSGDVISGSAGWHCGHELSTPEDAGSEPGYHAAAVQIEAPFLREIWSIDGVSATPGSSYVLTLRTTHTDMDGVFDDLSFSSLTADEAPRTNSGSHGHIQHARWSETYLDPHGKDAAAFRCSRRLLMASEHPIFGMARAEIGQETLCTPDMLATHAARRAETVTISTLTTGVPRSLYFSEKLVLTNSEVANSDRYINIVASDLTFTSYNAFFIQATRPGKTGRLTDSLITLTPVKDVSGTLHIRLAFSKAVSKWTTSWYPIANKVFQGAVSVGPVSGSIHFAFKAGIVFSITVPSAAACTYRVDILADQSPRYWKLVHFSTALPFR